MFPDPLFLNFCFPNQVLYHGGEILTMNGSDPEYVDCVVTEGESIVYSGGTVTIVITFIINDSSSLLTITTLFIGPRKTWGPIYGSGCPSVRHSETFVRL